MTRRPILMGEAERIATATEEPCPTALTRAVLDGYGSKPWLSITAKCHPSSGMEVWYHRANGCALLVCKKCKAGVARLQLALEVPS